MMKPLSIVVLSLALAAMAGCGGENLASTTEDGGHTQDSGTDAGADGAADVDTDTDADSDADGDTDTDADADADAEADAEADNKASVQFDWAIQGTDFPVRTYTCEEVGAAFIQMSFTVGQDTHYTAWYCTGSSGSAETDANFPVGTGTVKFELLNINGNLITTGVDKNGNVWGEVELVKGANNLEQVDFQFASNDVWDPTGTDATLWYTWTIDDPNPDDTDFPVPTADQCTTAGVDYVVLWIWNPNAEDWWTDESIMKADCAAGEIIPSDKFLAAGIYKFFGGFYKDNQPGPDILVYFDDFGDPTIDIVAQDAPNDLGVASIVTGAIQLGDLTLNLKWQDSDGNYQTDCTKAGVKKMGFLLRSDGWVAAEVPPTMDQAIDCLDEVVLEGIPYGTYEFLTEGVDDSYHIMWYRICNEISLSQPEASYDCEIKYQTPGQ